MSIVHMKDRSQVPAAILRPNTQTYRRGRGLTVSFETMPKRKAEAPPGLSIKLPDLKRGSSLGAWTIDRRLGAGAFGVVYAGSGCRADTSPNANSNVVSHSKYQQNFVLKVACKPTSAAAKRKDQVLSCIAKPTLRHRPTGYGFRVVEQ